MQILNFHKFLLLFITEKSDENVLASICIIVANFLVSNACST